MLGRYRLVPGVKSLKPKIAGDAIRQAVNHPVQTGAQEVVKAGMVKMWPHIRKYKRGIKPLLQVHDELVFDVRTDSDGWYADYAKSIIPMCMTSAMKLSVPIRVSMAEGNTWADLK